MGARAMQSLTDWNVLYTLIMTPLLLIFYTGAGGAVATAWAPFGALVCALIAWRRGLNPYRCGVAGAAYSALFFLPWVYLAVRMLGWTIPKPLMALPYVVLYGLWAYGPARYSCEIWMDAEAHRPAWLFAWLANMFTMVASLLLLTPFKRINPFYRARRDAPLRDTLPNPVYLLPFALFWGWTVALFALTVLSGSADR